MGNSRFIGGGIHSGGKPRPPHFLEKKERDLHQGTLAKK